MQFSLPDKSNPKRREKCVTNFCVEVKVSHQHWEEQDGSGWKWWERCSFEKFRDKFVHEAEQNRAP